MIRLPSIRAKLLALFLLVAAVPIGLVSLISFFNSIQAVEDMVGNEVVSLAEGLGGDYDRRLADRVDDRLLWVNRPVQDFLAAYPDGSVRELRITTSQLMRYLPDLFEQFGLYYDELLLADAAGEVLFKYHRAEGGDLVWALGRAQAARFDAPRVEARFPRGSGFPAAEADTVRGVVVGPDPTPAQIRRPTAPIGPVEPGQDVGEGDREAAHRGVALGSGEWLVVADLPTAEGNRAVRVVRAVYDSRDGDRQLGVVVTTLRNDYLFQGGMEGRQFGTGGQLLLLDRRSGEVLEHSRPDLVGQRLREADPRLLGRIQAGPEGAERVVRAPGEQGDRMVAVHALSTAPWSMVATAVPREFEREAREAGLLNLLVALVALLGAGAVLLFSSGRISDSIKQVSRGASEIAEGNLDHEIHVTTHDEIQDLGENFNRMTASLRENIELRERAVRELASLNRTLEDRVKERTAALEQTNTALEQANAELLELDRLKTHFLANVSHEFKTPLTSIQAFSEILLDEQEEIEAADPASQAGRFLQIIHSESQRLGRLIRNLLSLSQIESGRITWHESDFAIGEVMEAATDGLLPQLQDKAIRLERNLECGDAVVHGDRDRIQEVAANLLDNAVKFSDYESVIEIGCGPGAREGNGSGMVWITIRDHGGGIPPEKAESIFDRFSQVDPSDTREKGGTGLGLAICKEIVEHHGGRIWVESTPGEGAAFHFTLPRVEAPGEDRAGAPGERPAEEPGGEIG